MNHESFQVPCSELAVFDAKKLDSGNGIHVIVMFQGVFWLRFGDRRDRSFHTKRWLVNESKLWIRAARMVSQQQECGALSAHKIFKQLLARVGNKVG